MKRKWIPLILGATLAAASGMASAHGSVNFGLYVGAPAPVYYSPAPVYYPPPYYPPAPVYYAPAYYTPAYYGPQFVDVRYRGHHHAHYRHHGRR